ncbi:hypothetical protein ACFOWA_07155 [Pedobacter lithocola]|uniref:Lipoprotein n=1 Tax=Pedobacter lithocola TaxID=1908239 RepID=A0ABV8PA00_9SPHI
MTKINSKTALLLFVATIILLPSCIEKPKKVDESISTSKTAAIKKTISNYSLVNSWIDDLQNFRTAVSASDLEKMSTYFDFPIVNDTTQIWTAVYEGIEENKRPKEYKKFFTKEDLKEYHTLLFNEIFIKSLNKVKLEQLYKQNEFTTQNIKIGTSNYYVFASFDKTKSMLQVSIMFSGELDEEGNGISETESAIIYFFKIKDDKYLKFDKILFAG